VFRRVLWVVGGLILAAMAASLLTVGLLLQGTFGSSGSVITESGAVTGEGAALLSEGISLNGGSPLQRTLGRLTFGVRSPEGKALFLGLAPSESLFNYLDGAPYDIVTKIGPGRETTRPVPGSRTPARPSDQTFWVRQASGVTAQIDWPEDARAKGYRFVVMNADGSPSVDAVIVLGFVSDTVYPLSLGASLAGVLLLIPAIWMFYRGFRRAPVAPAAPAVLAIPDPQPVAVPVVTATEVAIPVVTGTEVAVPVVTVTEVAVPVVTETALVMPVLPPPTTEPITGEQVAAQAPTEPPSAG